jgi:hypothetical protein
MLQDTDRRSTRPNSRMWRHARSATACLGRGPRIDNLGLTKGFPEWAPRSHPLQKIIAREQATWMPNLDQTL